MSRDLITIIKRKEFKKLASGLPVVNDKMKNLTDLNVGISVLESMCELDCDKNCKSGGGGASCEIRKCNVRLELDGCWECENSEKCGAPVTVNGARKWVTFDDLEKNEDDLSEIGKAYEESETEFFKGRVGYAESILIPQRKLVNFAVEWMVNHRM